MGLSLLLKFIPLSVREILGLLEWKRLVLSVLPFVGYLILFSNNKEIREFTGLDHLSPPNFFILAKIEETVFFCHPHRILSKLANPVFDLLSAIPYLIHFPLPILFAVYLLITPKKRVFVYQFFWLHGWVNLIGVIIQITIPTAPPWFVDSAVFDEHGNVLYTVPVEGGFSRLDRSLGITLFHGLYSTSPLPFGAFPSLHCGWPTVVLFSHPWGGWKVGLTHVIWISFAAMYITHHYLVDILGAILLTAIVRFCSLKIWSPFPEIGDKVPNTARSDFLSV